jgi:hypothetical protein
LALSKTKPNEFQAGRWHSLGFLLGIAALSTNLRRCTLLPASAGGRAISEES